MTLKPPPKPCGSCPYRRDVPSGLWHPDEYAKLSAFDGAIPDQLHNGAHGVFMCHQNDGSLCGGWLATHGPENLLALRLARDVDPAVWNYDAGVEVFASGAEAALHGLQDVEEPSEEALRKINGLLKLQAKQGKKP